MCRSIRHLGRSLVWSVALTALVGACAPAQPPTPAAPRASDQSPAASGSQSTAAPAAQSPGASGASSTGPAEWVVAIAEEPASIDPAVGTAAAASMMAQLHLFDALVAFEGPTMKLVGKLAESWRVVDDNTWEFKLRQGVKFHNGDPFTAEDVRYSFDLYRDEKNARHTNLDGVTGLEVLDPYTIRLST